MVKKAQSFYVTLKGEEGISRCSLTLKNGQARELSVIDNINRSDSCMYRQCLLLQKCSRRCSQASERNGMTV